jgi:molybdate transport system substrate-binding protein
MKWVSVAVVLGFALAVVPQVHAEEITVGAAADLSYAMKSLVDGFSKTTSTQVRLSFGASGNLFSQIQNGAPFDLFFSADSKYPTELASAGLVDRPSVRTYAVGHLVLWVPNGLGLDPQKLKMDLLSDPKVKRIAIANPQHAPYGRAAMAALEHFGLKNKLAAKLVTGENISQTAQFVQSGNAQAGMIALSLALSPAMKEAGHYWELPADSYPELRQVAVVLSASKHKATAEQFLNYVTSPQGQAILQQYGFRTPQP